MRYTIAQATALAGAAHRVQRRALAQAAMAQRMATHASADELRDWLREQQA